MGRGGLHAVAGAVALAALWLLTLALWLGMPAGWLWIGSQVQGATGDVGAAIAAMIFGVVLTVLAVIPLLGRITRLYQRTRVARSLDDTGIFPLEVALTCTALVAGSGFVFWLLVLSDGTSPIPVLGR